MRLGPFAAMAVGAALFLGLAASSSGQSPSGRANKSVLPPLKEDARDPAATQSRYRPARRRASSSWISPTT